jgi:hypothetical protein
VKKHKKKKKALKSFPKVPGIRRQRRGGEDREVAERIITLISL